MRFLTNSIRLAVKNLRSNAGRTFLTLSGVIIAIASVILVVSSGQGVKNFVLSQVESFGDDVIQTEIKIPSTGKTSTQNASSLAQGVQITTLKISDAREIAKLPNVAEVYAGTIGQELVSYQGTNKRILLFGAGASAPAVDANLKVAEGVFYDESQDNSLAQVAVIGADVKESFFGEDQALGKNIRIRGQNYRVIGVLEKRGAVSFFNFDELIYVPVQTLQKKILGVDYVLMVMSRVKDKALVEETAGEITALMRRLHRIDNPDKDDFAVTSIREAREIIEDVFKTVNILLLSLVSISLLVGGVGIMNVMYVAVAERTFEIGLRKACGAGSKEILSQFLLEAVFITFLGGVIGVTLGFLGASGLSFIFSALGFSLDFPVTFGAVLLAFGFSAVTGIIFGFQPARRASRLSPMEALRKE